MSQMVVLVTWMGLLGIPSIFSVTIYCIRMVLKFRKNSDIMQKAIKAQMRSQLIDQFHKYNGRGYITEDELEDWENQFKAYHNLAGDNGVLDARRAKLLQMPTKEDAE